MSAEGQRGGREGLGVESGISKGAMKVVWQDGHRKERFRSPCIPDVFFSTAPCLLKYGNRLPRLPRRPTAKQTPR